MSDKEKRLDTRLIRVGDRVELSDPYESGLTGTIARLQLGKGDAYPFHAFVQGSTRYDPALIYAKFPFGITSITPSVDRSTAWTGRTELDDRKLALLFSDVKDALVHAVTRAARIVRSIDRRPKLEL